MSKHIPDADDVSELLMFIRDHADDAQEARRFVALVLRLVPQSPLSEEEHTALLEAVAVLSEPASVYADTIRGLIDRFAPLLPESQV